MIYNLRCQRILIGISYKTYETEDNTRGSQELACKAGSCELVDI